MCSAEGLQAYACCFLIICYNISLNHYFSKISESKYFLQKKSKLFLEKTGALPLRDPCWTAGIATLGFTTKGTAGRQVGGGVFFVQAVAFYAVCCPFRGSCEGTLKPGTSSNSDCWKSSLSSSAGSSSAVLTCAIICTSIVLSLYRSVSQ